MQNACQEKNILHIITTIVMNMWFCIKKMKLLLIIGLVFTISCQRRQAYDLKSPCVSSKDGPCTRRPVNTWLNSSHLG